MQKLKNKILNFKYFNNAVDFMDNPQHYNKVVFWFNSFINEFFKINNSEKEFRVDTVHDLRFVLDKFFDSELKDSFIKHTKTIYLKNFALEPLINATKFDVNFKEFLVDLKKLKNDSEVYKFINFI